MLKILKQEGITILVSTAYMDEADLCERIALIQEGRILSIDTPANIVAGYPDHLFAVKADRTHQLLNDIRQYPDTLSCFSFGEFLHLAFRSKANNQPEKIEQWLNQKGHLNLEIKKITANIEDRFIQLMHPTNPIS